MSQKELTLENLKSDEVSELDLAWIAPILNAGRVPTGDEWRSRPDYYLWALGRGYDLPLDVVDYCAREHPALALHAAAYLPTDTLDYCARRFTWAALLFAASHLSPGALQYCASQHPSLVRALIRLKPELEERIKS